jgi:hypothetical protein
MATIYHGDELIEELVDAYCGNGEDDFGRYAGNLLQKDDSFWDPRTRMTSICIHGVWHISGGIVVSPVDFVPVLLVGPWEVSLDYLSDELQEELKNNARK